MKYLKTRSFALLVFASICVSGLSGCKSNADTVIQSGMTTAASVEVLANENTLSLVTTISTEDMTQAVIESVDTSTDDTTVTEFVFDREVYPLDYNAYYAFMLSNIGASDNAVFSPESLNAALDLYSEVTDDAGRSSIDYFIGNRNYFDYKSTDVFKIVNRLWYNTNKNIDFSSNQYLVDSGVLYGIDMNNPLATDEKNAYVAEQTNNFIKSTPTIFTSETVFDAMNVVYFKDTWRNGDKYLDNGGNIFNNADGSSVKLAMMHDNGGLLQQTDFAYAYTMDYNDGFTITVMLPKPGCALSDIDINAFVTDAAEIMYEDCLFSMPEFETSSSYMMTMDSFHIGEPNLDTRIYNNPTNSAEITQIARIKVDHEGTEAAAVTEIVKSDGMAMPSRDPFVLTCNKSFAYYIKDTVNDDVAFIGAVTHLDGDPLTSEDWEAFHNE